jgi:hypothetical protein
MGMTLLAVKPRGCKNSYLGNLWRLCPHHHTLKTLYGWRVVTDADGIHQLVPPDDPDPP